MFSKGILQSIRIIFKIGGTFGSFPYDWDSNSQQLKLKTSPMYIFRWKVIISYTFVNAMFMVIRLVQATCCMNISYAILFVNLFHLLTWTCVTAFHINTLSHREEFLEFVNMLIETNHYFERAMRQAGDGDKSTVTSSSRVFTYAIYAYCFLNFFIALKAIPSNPKYWFSLTGIRGLAPWKLVPFAMFESYMSFLGASIMLLYIIFYLCYVKSTSLCLEILWYAS